MSKEKRYNQKYKKEWEKEKEFKGNEKMTYSIYSVY